MKILTIIAFLAALPALAEETKCISGTDIRLMVLSKVEEGCQLNYTKSGDTKTLATQRIGNEKCNEVRDRVKTKLEAAGYSCTQDEK